MTDTPLTTRALAHWPGPLTRYGGFFIQRCRLCGVQLTRIHVSRWHPDLEWDPASWVMVDPGGASWDMKMPAVEFSPSPGDACT